MYKTVGLYCPCKFIVNCVLCKKKTFVYIVRVNRVKKNNFWWQSSLLSLQKRNKMEKNKTQRVLKFCIVWFGILLYMPEKRLTLSHFTISTFQLDFEQLLYLRLSLELNQFWFLRSPPVPDVTWCRQICDGRIPQYLSRPSRDRGSLWSAHGIEKRK